MSKPRFDSVYTLLKEGSDFIPDTEDEPDSSQQTNGTWTDGREVPSE